MNYLSDVLVKKLKYLKEEIDKLNNKYNNIVKEVGYDIETCHVCEGRGIYNKFIGNDCNGKNYRLEECYYCNGDLYVLKAVEEE